MRLNRIAREVLYMYEEDLEIRRGIEAFIEQTPICHQSFTFCHIRPAPCGECLLSSMEYATASWAYQKTSASMKVYLPHQCAYMVSRFEGGKVGMCAADEAC